MLTNLLVRWSVLAGVVVTVASAVTAAPPPLDIPASGVVGPAQMTQIDERLKYYGTQIASATKDKDILSARKGLRDDYLLTAAGDFQYTYARRAAAILTPMLESGIKSADPLKTVKEVNLALALARMPQVTVQPAMETLVAHANPAVRYQGWEGYREIRMLVLAQGQEFASRMKATYQKRAAAESSPAVIGSILQMAILPPVAGGAVPEADMREAQAFFFGTLKANWARWCQLAADGSEDMLVSAARGLQALRNYDAFFTGDKDKKNAIVQMIVDMLWCAAEAYDQAGGKGLAADASVALLRDSEMALNAVTQKRKGVVEASLSDAKIVERGAAVKLAVLDWVADLKEFGVTKPAFASEQRKTTTLPAATGSAAAR